MMIEPEVNLELGLQHGLSEEEYNRMVEILGRVPNYTELGIFSVMWSEHCSYKNSIAVLKTLPREGRALLTKAGEENAGAVDIGDGLAVVFKIESHNHPTAVEPYQAAATGIGGILRDVFTMGARPIAALNSLRFGDLKHPRARYLLDGAVRGIGDYGNSFGVPTVGGEIYFDDCYLGNPLVNAMAVGIVKSDGIVSGTAEGVGNPVFIVGSSTGRDGIHGATFASEEISEKSESKRPSVQIGDPFTEKLLLEATLEIIKQDLVVGIQDMGAAGITCSTTEMSDRGGSGMKIDISKVPVREEGMIPYEIMLSESQERMLVVGKKDKEEELKAVFKKWGLPAVKIGEVTDDGMVTVNRNGEVVAQVPAYDLVLGGGAPVYEREREKPSYLDEIRMLDIDSVPVPDDLNQALLKLLSAPSIANKGWIYHQYDHMVRTNTAIFPGGDAAVLRVRKTRKGLAFSTDCNGRYCYINPRRGAMIAVSESARNVVASGAKPVAITNCLNFGNPYKPEMFWCFYEAVMGMGEACRKFDTPVTGGNVSFYNEDQIGGRAVYPTPTIGMMGVLEDIDHRMTSHFKSEGDAIILIGKTHNELGASEYIRVIHDLIKGDIPALDLDYEQKNQEAVLELIKSGLVKSCHDLAEGGLGIALAESCIMDREKQVGCRIDIESDLRPDVLLFSESQSRFLISIDPKNNDEVEKRLKELGIDYRFIGHVQGEKLIINDLIEIVLTELDDKWYNSITRIMEQQV
ncbi:MAG TPA: phosphoribosylformylglycinamidine synthase subunit PurL [candidate division Zixibacteria bacterium]|nr:phosphoribosylformylglycinamidine synthase subunit PurL [candidate division Zixibacteria bacterium]